MLSTSYVCKLHSLPWSLFKHQCRAARFRFCKSYVAGQQEKKKQNKTVSFKDAIKKDRLTILLTESPSYIAFVRFNGILFRLFWSWILPV